jgi:tetratricopeptide (TPR) repeat protein
MLAGFVNRRNDSVQGHGIPGDFDRETDLSLVGLTIELLQPILPVIDKVTGTLKARYYDGRSHELELLRAYGGDLICYRRIQPIAGGRCRIDAQRQTSLLTRSTETYEAPDLLGRDSTTAQQQYKLVDTADRKWSAFTFLPDRLTDCFTGRQNEIDALVEWLNDTESHACMLFGDGGIGKTTLVVELIHRLLEGKLSSSWKPELITFYTAKKTRWGNKGLEIINTRQLGVTDVALEVVRRLGSSPLGKDWLSMEPNPLCQKVAGFLADHGLKRSSHLIILDNTETMASSEEDVKALAKHIKELCRRVGRVLMTSRRREPIEANPIELTQLSEDESTTFLKERGKQLKLRPFEQAPASTLRSYARKLGNKPLMLEVFVQSVSENAASLEKGFEKVLRLQQEDLGEFLFADAWARMSDDIRLLLLLMTRVADLHDELLLKLCCLQSEVTIVQATEALQESRGLATIYRIDGRIQISFNTEFMKFCEGKTVVIDGHQKPSDASVALVKKQYDEFLKSMSIHVYDRHAMAFRHVLARAAWSAYQNGHYEECELFFDEAASEDSSNAMLFDRYAYFLFKRNRLEDALQKASKAVQLDPSASEAWFTKGLIEARLGRTHPSLSSLAKAESLGKPRHLCLLQMVYAHENDSPPNLALARACLEESEASTPPFSSKRLTEIASARARLEYLEWERKRALSRAGARKRQKGR